MKNFCIIIFIAFSTSLFAQDRLIKPEIYLGANFGVTESMVMFKPAVQQGFLQGYSGGFVFRYIAEKNVGMQAELNFSQRGWTENSVVTINQDQANFSKVTNNSFGKTRLGHNINVPLTTNVIFTRQLNYIELPFLTHIYIGNKNRFFINLGPKISYLLMEKTVSNQSNSTDLQHITPVQKPFDYGLCAGLGILFNVHGNILQLDSRAYYALSDIYPNSKSDYFSNSNNLNLSVNLAWLIQVK